MNNPTNSETNNRSSRSTTLIVVIGLIIIGLLVVILFVLLGNRNSSPPDAGGGSEPPAIELPSQLPSGPTVTALEAINIRGGPSTDYPSYGIAPEGSVGEVIGVSTDGGWWVIKLPTSIATSGQGWVSAQYVQADNIGEPPVIEAPPVE